MTYKPVHLMILLLAMLGLASSLCAADKLPPEGTAPIAAANPQGPFEIMWITPKVDPHNFWGDAIFSRDGKRLLVALDGEAQVWDTQTWKAIGPRIAYGDWLRRVQFAAAGKRVLVIRNVMEFNDELLPTGKVVKHFKYVDVEWRVWDVETGKPVGPSVQHERKDPKKLVAMSAELSPDGKSVSVVDGTIVELWSVETGKKDHAFEYSKWVGGRWFSPDSKSLVLVDSKGDANVCNVESGEFGKSKPGFSSLVTAQWRQRAGGRVLLDDFFGFRVIDIETGNRLLMYDDFDKYQMGELILSPSGNRVAVEDNFRNVIQIWDVDARKKIAEVPANGPVIMDPKGTVLIVNHWTAKRGDDAFEAGMWDAQTGKKVRDLGDFTGEVAFHPGGNLLVILNGRTAWAIHADPTKKGAERWKVDKVEEKK